VKTIVSQKSPSKVILICGLPGSGKTYLGNKLSKETGLEFIDDDILDKKPRILQSNGCIVADPAFIFTKTRKAVTKFLKGIPNIEWEWLFFENDPEQCLINVDNRNDERRVSSFIKSFSNYYIIPTKRKVIPVYRKEQV